MGLLEKSWISGGNQVNKRQGQCELKNWGTTGAGQEGIKTFTLPTLKGNGRKS
jgi:hypothetical protein